MKTGANILLASLTAQGVKTIFGYPGSTVLPIYDELQNFDIQHILVRHEQAAAHAADGFSRAGGDVGVCLATSGPGACNLVTGIATAYMDSVPMIAITGQVPTHMMGNDAFQEADITGITRPIVKQNYQVTHPSDICGIVSEAFHVAKTGRPGPVLIDIPKDVSTGMLTEDTSDILRKSHYRISVSADYQDFSIRAATMIADAEKPLIYAGGGAIHAGASEEIRILAEMSGIPVTTSLLGLGLIPSDHPLNLGMIGMHGTIAANHAVAECDLLIAIGARFSDRVCGTSGTFAPHASVIQIDIDPKEIGKNRSVDLGCIGNAKPIVQKINQRLAHSPKTRMWMKQTDEWRRQSSDYLDPNDGMLYPQQIIRTLSSLLKGEGIIVSEVGQNQMWTAQHFRFSRPRSFLTSGGLGTMGFGLPAAMGAHFARPDQDVCTIAGDGSLQMNIQEFATLAEYQIPVKIFVLNNQYLGMVRQWQELFYDRRYAFTELPSIEFTRIAAAYGIGGIKVETPDAVEGALRAALDTEGPYLIDFRIEREENVFPMIPAGAQSHEMLLKNPI